MFKGIIAIAENRVIGNQGRLPWPKEKSDLSFFKEITWGGNVIFGRKTFDGLGKTWLPNRNIYVMTGFNGYGWNQSKCKLAGVNSCTRIIQRDSDLPNGQDFWVCGGKGVYDFFMPQIEEFYVTYINGYYEGDVSMPEFEVQFKKSKTVKQHENYHTVKYSR